MVFTRGECMEKQILEQWIQRLKKKEEEAFDVIYEEYKNLIYYCIYQITKDAMLSEDILQEAFLHMIENIHHYQENTNFKAWFVRLAKNLTLNQLRNKKETIPLTEEVLYKKSDSNHETFELIRHLESFLSKEEVEIVVLKIVYQFTHQEIANTLDKPLGTVLWIYQKAVKKMKQHY